MADHVKVPPFTTAPTFEVLSAQQTFAFSFPFWEAADVQVLIDGALLDPSVYTVTGSTVQNGDPVTGGFGGGSVTLNVPVMNTTVTIDRLVVAERQTDYGPNGPLPLLTMNSDLDRLTARDQDILRRVLTALENAEAAGQLTPDDVSSIIAESLSPYATKAGAAALAPVQSWAGKQGNIVPTAADVGLGNVDNSSDALKPVSFAQAAADATRIPLAGSTGVTGELAGAPFQRPAMGSYQASANAIGRRLNLMRMSFFEWFTSDPADGTEVSAVLQQALSALSAVGGGVLRWPRFCGVLRGNVTCPDNVSIEGDSSARGGEQQDGNYLTTGSCIAIASGFSLTFAGASSTLANVTIANPDLLYPQIASDRTFTGAMFTQRVSPPASPYAAGAGNTTANANAVAAQVAAFAGTPLIFANDDVSLRRVRIIGYATGWKVTAPSRGWRSNTISRFTVQDCVIDAVQGADISGLDDWSSMTNVECIGLFACHTGQPYANLYRSGEAYYAHGEVDGLLMTNCTSFQHHYGFNVVGSSSTNTGVVLVGCQVDADLATGVANATRGLVTQGANVYVTAIGFQATAMQYGIALYHTAGWVEFQGAIGSCQYWAYFGTQSQGRFNLNLSGAGQGLYYQSGIGRIDIVAPFVSNATNGNVAYNLHNFGNAGDQGAVVCDAASISLDGTATYCTDNLGTQRAGSFRATGNGDFTAVGGLNFGVRIRQGTGTTGATLQFTSNDGTTLLGYLYMEAAGVGIQGAGGQQLAYFRNSDKSLTLAGPLHLPGGASTIIFDGNLINAASDSAAASAGVPINGEYKNGNTVLIRES